MSRASPRYRRVNPSLPAVGAANGVVLYRIWGQLENQLTISSFMYSAAVPAPTNAALTALLTAISTNMYAAYQGCVSGDWTTTQETLDVVHRNDIIGVTSNTHFGTGGSRPVGHVPTEVALQVIRYSAVKGQHGRGRVGLPGLSTADVTNSKATSAAILTALATLRTQMLVTASDGVSTWTPCIGQRAPTTPRLVIGFSPLTRITTPVLLGTVRRRKIGRGK